MLGRMAKRQKKVGQNGAIVGPGYHDVTKGMSDQNGLNKYIYIYHIYVV
jgi:hypothetical protein